MVQRKRRRTVRKTARRTTKKKTRMKKGVSARSGLTAAQKRKLQKTLGDIEKHITTLTRKYNAFKKAMKKW